MNVFAGHLGIVHQKNGGRQTGQAGAHNVGGPVLNAFGLAGMNKRFIITAAVIASIFVEILCCSGLDFPRWRYDNSRAVNGQQYGFFEKSII